MRSIRTFAIAASISALLVGTAATAGATININRFDDGSFENPRVAANTFVTINSGQFIGPWRIDSGNVDLMGAGIWQAAEGDQSVDLNGTAAAGVVSQTFTTVPGKRYTVTYSLAGNPNSGPTIKTGQVRIDGQSFQDFSFDVSGKSNTNMGYVTRDFNFVARNTSTTLTFVSTTANSSFGPVIDDVLVRLCPPCPQCG